MQDMIETEKNKQSFGTLITSDITIEPKLKQISLVINQEEQYLINRIQGKSDQEVFKYFSTYHLLIFCLENSYLQNNGKEIKK